MNRTSRHIASALVVGMACAVGCDRLRPGATGGAVADPSPVDYPTFRKTFETKLTRRGPAPPRGGAEPVAPDAEVVAYKSGELPLTAWVSRDATRPGAKKPGVLFLHGGFAFGADDWDQTGPFRRAGFHVMVPLLRGENGQPGVFTLHVGEADDALAALAAFGGLPGVDENNLFVCGHSIGGTLAMFVALGSDRVRAAAPISGAPDCAAHISGQTEVAPFAPSDPLELRARSPGAFARSFRCPVRAYYGDDEAAFFELDTQAMAAAAQAAGKDVQAVRLPGDHMSVVDPATARAVTFFREHLVK